MKSFRNSVRGLLLALLAVLASLAFAADEYDRVVESANRFAANGHAVLVTADRLQSLLTDADLSNDPVLVSACAPGDFAKAHIKGSIKIPRGAIGPAVVLNLMGYKAAQLEWGLMGWSKNDVALGPATRFPESQQDHPVAAPPKEAQMTYVRPSWATGKAGLAEILVARADAVEAADKTVSMTAEAVQALLTDANPTNDPYVVDIRAPADYAKGHIKGAVNIPAAKVYQDCYLAMLPPSRRIVVADYIGQTAVGTSYALSIVGYNARALQFGMMGWTKDDRVPGPHERFPVDAQRDHPVVSASR